MQQMQQTTPQAVLRDGLDRHRWRAITKIRSGRRLTPKIPVIATRRAFRITLMYATVGATDPSQNRVRRQQRKDAATVAGQGL
jgi:hypothetical protein